VFFKRLVKLKKAKRKNERRPTYVNTPSTRAHRLRKRNVNFRETVEGTRSRETMRFVLETFASIVPHRGGSP